MVGQQQVHLHLQGAPGHELRHPGALPGRQPQVRPENLRDHRQKQCRGHCGGGHLFRPLHGPQQELPGAHLPHGQGGEGAVHLPQRAGGQRLPGQRLRDGLLQERHPARPDRRPVCRWQLHRPAGRGHPGLHRRPLRPTGGQGRLLPGSGPPAGRAVPGLRPAQRQCLRPGPGPVQLPEPQRLQGRRLRPECQRPPAPGRHRPGRLHGGGVRLPAGGRSGVRGAHPVLRRVRHLAGHPRQAGERPQLHLCAQDRLTVRRAGRPAVPDLRREQPRRGEGAGPAGSERLRHARAGAVRLVHHE